jgi:EF-P beta-lysylation protein EpmB
MWQNILKTNITSYSKLIEHLQLSEDKQKKILKKADFSLNLPLRLANKIQKDTLEDPILKQFVPLVEEVIDIEGFNENPIGDCEAVRAPKLLSKYQGRNLILTTSACAMHCRFCFRKEFEYAKFTGFEAELATIQADATIQEVLLSGGDPLSLSNRQLGELLEQLEAIPHVKRLRFHTRFLIGIPERVDLEFLQLLKKCSKTIIFVFHINHPLELDQEVFLAMNQLRAQGMLLFSQSVLLKGVNDQVAILSELFLKLIDQGIVPYYLHQLDRVKGASHFEVPILEGKRLMEEVHRRLPGYAIPSYVQEVAKLPYKLGINIFSH